MLACGVATALVCMAAARDIWLAWEPSPTESVDSYVVSMGTNSGIYFETWPVEGRLTAMFVVTNLGPGRYFFVVQAHVPSGLLSDYSNQVEALVSTPPQLHVVDLPAVRLAGVVYHATNAIGPWRELVRLPVVEFPLLGELGFFRLGLEWSPVELPSQP